MTTSENSHPPLRVPLSKPSPSERKDGGAGNDEIAKHSDADDEAKKQEGQKSEGQPNAASGSTR